jgi:hypothetical protein
MAAGDIDNDGDVDAVFAAFFGSSGCCHTPYVYLGNGAGHFVLDATRFSRAPMFRNGAAVADVDRDGDQDVIFTGSTGPRTTGLVELWLNDGRGYFTDATTSAFPAGTDAFVPPAVGDLNGDGYPEIVIGQGNQGLASKRVLWNNGNGSFTVQPLLPNSPVMSCHLLDMDRDSDLDVFFFGDQPMLYFNEPNGLRQVLVRNPDPTTSEAPASIGDVNADGYPDVIFAGTVNEPSVLLNDGRGNLVLSPGWIHGEWRRGIWHFTFADLDGDGDEDAFAGALPIIFGYNGDVFFNRHRQLWGPPDAPRGTLYPLQATGRRNTSFVVALSTARLATPWSLGALGAWHLDPATTTLLGVTTVDGNGMSTLPLLIPNRAVVGRSLFVQGFDLGTSLPRLERATNFWQFTVR